LQDENDELRKMIGWLSSHEPQLKMMIEAYKRYDGQALGQTRSVREVVRMRGRSEIS
jgi:hypothetical protein